MTRSAARFAIALLKVAPGVEVRSDCLLFAWEAGELEHHQHKHNVKIPFDPPLNLRDLEPSHFVQGWVRTAVDAHTTRKLYFRALCSFEWKVGWQPLS